MANPSRRTPFVVEWKYGEKWYPLDAFRTRADAEEMLPIYQKRMPGEPLRVRDTGL